METGDTILLPDGWALTYPKKEWCIYEKQRRGCATAQWTADKDGINCSLSCSGYGAYSDSSYFPWDLLAQLAETQGYELKKKP